MAMSPDVETALALTVNVLALLLAIIQSIFSWQCLAALKNERRAGFASLREERSSKITDADVHGLVETDKPRK